MDRNTLLFDPRSAIMGIAFAAMWASAFTASRIIVTSGPPLTALSLRFLLAGCLALVLGKMMGQKLQLSRPEWRTVIIFGVCQNSLYLGFNWIAMQSIEAGAAAIIASTMPLLVALIGRTTAGPLKPMAATGMIAGFAGVALIMTTRLNAGLDPRGVLLCVMGVLALTVATLVVGKSGTGRNVMMIVGAQMVIGGVALIPAAIWREWPAEIDFTPELVGAMTYAILIPGILATFIWFRLVARIGATRAATFHFLSPLFGVLIGAAVLGETFGWNDAFGAVAIAGGILAVQLAR